MQVSTDSPLLTEGAITPEIRLSFMPASAKVCAIAVWMPASRQVLDDNDGLRDFVNTTLLDALDLAKESQILLWSGLTGNLAGLLTETTACLRHVSGDSRASPASSGTNA